MSSRGKPQLSARVPSAIKRAYRENAEEMGRDMSTLIQNAVIHYLDVHEDLEVSNAVEKVLENKKEYNLAEDEEFFRNMERKRVRATYMEATYIEYMDDFLASLYLSNRDYYGEDDLEALLKEHMTVLERRAEHHGVHEAYEQRTEEPLEYAKEYIERKKVEDKAFKDDANKGRTGDLSDE